MRTASSMRTEQRGHLVVRRELRTNPLLRLSVKAGKRSVWFHSLRPCTIGPKSTSARRTPIASSEAMRRKTWSFPREYAHGTFAFVRVTVNQKESSGLRPPWSSTSDRRPRRCHAHRRAKLAATRSSGSRKGSASARSACWLGGAASPRRRAEGA